MSIGFAGYGPIFSEGQVNTIKSAIEAKTAQKGQTQKILIAGGLALVVFLVVKKLMRKR